MSRRPTWARIVGLSLLLGLSLAAITGLSLSWRFGWSAFGQIAVLAAIFGFGGAAALGASAAFSWLVMPNGRTVWRAALIAGLTLVAGLAITGGLLTLDYRSYYGQWHAPAFSRLWLWQQVFTTAAAIYQYAVIGPRVYGLAGLAVLAWTSWWAGRPAH